jgi:ParB-like chromosome segregation protein Spo0J
MPIKIQRNKKIKISQLTPNEWNPNVMNERQEEALEESMDHYGQIMPIIVRPSKKNKDQYEIIDGEHRYKNMEKEGDIYVNILEDISDEDAKKLTVILNETRGDADKIQLAGLLKELGDSIDFNELKIGLPFSDNEIKELIEVGKFEWDQWDEAANKADLPTSLQEGLTIVAKFDKNEKDFILSIMSLIQEREGIKDFDQTITNALVIKHLCEVYREVAK